MKPETPLKDGDMQDALYAKHGHIFKAGDRKKQKTRYNRVVRHKVKKMLVTMDDPEELDEIDWGEVE